MLSNHPSNYPQNLMLSTVLALAVGCGKVPENRDLDRDLQLEKKRALTPPNQISFYLSQEWEDKMCAARENGLRSGSFSLNGKPVVSESYVGPKERCLNITPPDFKGVFSESFDLTFQFQGLDYHFYSTKGYRDQFEIIFQLAENQPPFMPPPLAEAGQIGLEVVRVSEEGIRAARFYTDEVLYECGSQREGKLRGWNKGLLVGKNELQSSNEDNGVVEIEFGDFISLNCDESGSYLDKGKTDWSYEGEPQVGERIALKKESRK